jgi:hypothetical protein
MNNQPVTVEQLMQAVSMLGARPEYKQYTLTDPVFPSKPTISFAHAKKSCLGSLKASSTAL